MRAAGEAVFQALLPLPAEVTCRNCLASPAARELARRQEEQEAVTGEPPAGEKPPVPAPGPGEYFTVTEQHVKDGLFAGVASVQPKGRRHVFFLDQRRGTVSFCGINADRIDNRSREVPAVWHDLPAGTDCLLCAPKAAGRLGDFEMFGPGLVYTPDFPEELTAEEQNLELRKLVSKALREAHGHQATLERERGQWEHRAAAMGKKISVLKEELRVASQARPPVAELAVPGAAPRLEAAQREAGIWKGVTGFLVWKYAGAGTSVKEVVLNPAEYATAAAQVIGVSISSGQDGSLTLTGRLRLPPGPQAALFDRCILGAWRKPGRRFRIASMKRWPACSPRRAARRGRRTRRPRTCCSWTSWSPRRCSGWPRPPPGGSPTVPRPGAARGRFTSSPLFACAA
jgi:hypothetical protein